MDSIASIVQCMINKKAVLSQKWLRDVSYINGLEKISLGMIFLARNFDDHTIIILKLIFSWMVGKVWMQI